MKFKKPAFFLILLLIILSSIFDQPKAQSLRTSVDITGIVSSSSSAPFWIQSNRHGIYSDQGEQFLTRIQAHGNTELFENRNITLGYGAELITRPGKNGTLSFNQAYLNLEMYGVELAGGRFNSYSPIHDSELGMGSLGVSGNAVPVPQLRIGLADWTSLPYTNDFIQIRAHTSHGWLGSRRYTKDVLYHEKVGHARFGGDFPLNVYGGIAHYAKWGGRDNPQLGNLPSKFSDYWRVFIAISGDEDAPATEADYMLGDHLGAWDFGFFLELDDLSINIYSQHPLETKDNLKLKSLQDALNGISFRFSENLGIPITGFVYEFMFTKWQDGPRLENVLEDGTPCSQAPERCRDHFRGNENYYNHGIYRTGWATQGRTIGNPLFRISDIPLHQLREGIDNNRIVAHHIGVSTRVWRSSVIAKVTKSRNFGTRNNPFPETAEQISVGVQSETPVDIFNQPFIILAETAWDRGDLFGSQAGLLLGIRWIR